MNARSKRAPAAPFAAALLAAACCLPIPAWAVPITFELSGAIDGADDDNPFGLSVGDLVEIMAMFDDDLIAAPGKAVVSFNEFGNAADGMFTVTAGGIVLTRDNDISAGDDPDGNTVFPTITFLDGAFDGLDFLATGGVNGSTVSLAVFVSGGGVSNFINGDGIDGSVDVASASIVPKSTPVPEPATLALLGAGLVGLMGRRRRKG